MYFFFLSSINSNEINHLIFWSTNLMVIKMSVYIISCVECACDRAFIAALKLHKSKMAWLSMDYTHFLSGFKCIASLTIFLWISFFICFFHHFNVSTHGDSREREKAVERLDNNSMQWMEYMCCVVWYLPTCLITKAWQLKQQHRSGNSSSTSTLPTNKNWFSVCAQGTSYYLTLAQNSIEQ